MCGVLHQKSSSLGLYYAKYGEKRNEERIGCAGVKAWVEFFKEFGEKRGERFCNNCGVKGSRTERQASFVVFKKRNLNFPEIIFLSADRVSLERYNLEN